MIIGNWGIGWKRGKDQRHARKYGKKKDILLQENDSQNLIFSHGHPSIIKIKVDLMNILVRRRSAAASEATNM